LTKTYKKPETNSLYIIQLFLRSLLVKITVTSMPKQHAPSPQQQVPPAPSDTSGLSNLHLDSSLKRPSSTLQRPHHRTSHAKVGKLDFDLTKLSDDDWHVILSSTNVRNTTDFVTISKLDSLQSQNKKRLINWLIATVPNSTTVSRHKRHHHHQKTAQPSSKTCQPPPRITSTSHSTQLSAKSSTKWPSQSKPGPVNTKV